MNALLAKIEAGAKHATASPWKTKTGKPLGPWVNEDSETLASDGRPIFHRNWKEACLNAAHAANVDPETTRKLIRLILAQNTALINSLRFITAVGVGKVREHHKSLDRDEALTIYESKPDVYRESVKVALAMLENLK